MTIIIGSIGAALALLAFLMNQSGRWNSESRAYDLTNFLSGLILFIYAYLLGSIPFMIINAVWGLVSLKDLLLKDRK